jgi:hypothetical protein
MAWQVRAEEPPLASFLALSEPLCKGLGYPKH